MFSTQSDNCTPFAHIFDIIFFFYLLLNWKSPKLAYEVKGEVESSEIFNMTVFGPDYIHLREPRWRSLRGVIITLACEDGLHRVIYTVAITPLSDHHLGLRRWVTSCSYEHERSQQITNRFGVLRF